MTTEQRIGKGSQQEETPNDAVASSPVMEPLEESAFTKKRVKIGVTAWFVAQVGLVLIAPVVGGQDLVLVYNAVSAVSILTSWFLLMWMLRLKLVGFASLGVLVPIGLSWIYSPFERYSVLSEVAYAYHTSLAAWAFLVGTPVILLAFRVLRKAEEGAGPPAPRSLALELRYRARKYRFESRWSLLVIVVAIAVGATIFVLADGIASRNVHRALNEARDAVSSVRLDHSVVNGALADTRELLEEVLALQEERRETVQSVSSSLVETLLRENYPEPGESQAEAAAPTQGSESTLVRELSGLGSELELIRVRLSERETYLGQAGDGPSRQFEEVLTRIAEENEADTALRTILSSLSTRIGALLLIVFLVQILAGLYRYSARMAAHYEASADVLSFANDLGDRDPVALLSNAHVDFEKAPQTPAVHIREIVAGTVEALKGRT